MFELKAHKGGLLTAKERAASRKSNRRADLARKRERVELVRKKLQAIKEKRSGALATAIGVCQQRSGKLREKVKAYRAKERERVNLEVPSVRHAGKFHYVERAREGNDATTWYLQNSC